MNNKHALNSDTQLFSCKITRAGRSTNFKNVENVKLDSRRCCTADDSCTSPSELVTFVLDRNFSVENKKTQPIMYEQFCGLFTVVSLRRRFLVSNVRLILYVESKFECWL